MEFGKQFLVTGISSAILGCIHMEPKFIFAANAHEFGVHMYETGLLRRYISRKSPDRS